jgi:hypothetical protein
MNIVIRAAGAVDIRGALLLPCRVSPSPSSCASAIPNMRMQCNVEFIECQMIRVCGLLNVENFKMTGEDEIL